MHARDRLHVLVWPFHNGLRHVSMGSGPIRLATDDEFRAGIGADRLGVIWFDAHAGFDDPEENEPGFFDVWAWPC